MPAILDAATLRDAMTRYLEALRLHREEIDSLNVFPVPDGDTGTNLLLTQQAVIEALRELEGAGLPEISQAISEAALLGARGNSGVILSQVLRGLCARLPHHDAPGSQDLAAALSGAAEDARAAVANPVEGTMLSVLWDAAEGARMALADDLTCEDVAAAALEAATASLERTREQLPALAAAGVVDAGGKGVVLLLDAMVAALRGDGRLSTAVGPLGPVGGSVEADLIERQPTGRGFEVMYLLECPDDRIGSLKERLGTLGDSLVVVGGRGLYNVHVHVEEAGPAVEVGVEAGRPRQIRITSLTDQVEACLGNEARRVRISPPGSEEPPAGAVMTSALVAVAEGAGFVELFRSLGAAIVPGGSGLNPAVGEIRAAIEAAPADLVFVLANDPNVVPAAETAASASSKRVEVIATPTMAQGVSVAAAYSQDDEEVGESLRERLSNSASGSLARAVRQADSGAGVVRPGSWVGILYGRDGSETIVSTAEEVAPVAEDLAAVLADRRRPGDGAVPAFELLTLYVGSEGRADEAAAVAARIRDALPQLEVEVQGGGQPIHAYLFGIE